MSHSGSFEIRRKSTHEQLRSNHIDTLYTLEKTLSENEALRNQLQALQERFDKLSADVQLATPTEVIINQLHTENSSLKVTVTEQSKKLSEHEISIKTLNTSKATLEKKFNAKITEITYAQEDAMKRQNVLHATRYNMLSEDYAVLLLRLQEAKSLCAQRDSVLIERSKSQEQVSHLQQQIAHITSSLNSKQSANNALQQEITQLRETHLREQVQHKATEDQLRHQTVLLEKELNLSRELCKKLQQRVHELEDQVSQPKSTFFATALETPLLHSSSTSCLPRTPETKQERVPTLPPCTQESNTDTGSTTGRFTFEEFVALKRENQAIKLQLAALSDSIKKGPLNATGVIPKSSNKHTRTVSASNRR